MCLYIYAKRNHPCTSKLPILTLILQKLINNNYVEYLIMKVRGYISLYGNLLEVGWGGVGWGHVSVCVCACVCVKYIF